MSDNTDIQSIQNRTLNGKTNRRKGFNAERLYAKIFRNLGYDKCKTTRESSRLLDSCKVDLNFLPILVQIKAGIQKKFNASKTLFLMNEELNKHYDKNSEILDMPKIIIHHTACMKNKKRTEYDDLVIMTFNTFKRFLKDYNKTN